MRIDRFYRGNSKSCGFSRTGLGLADHIASTHYQWNSFGLDRGGFFEAEAIDRFE